MIYMKYLIYLTLSFLFIACGNNNSENSYKVDLSNSKNDSLISNKNYVVNADGDSILTGHPVLAQGEVIEKDIENISVFEYINKKPHIIPITATTKLVSNEMEFLAKQTKIITPGKDSIPLPRDTVVEGLIVSLIMPKSKKISNYKRKENASFDIQYLMVEEGLSSTEILVLFQDKNNNIWIGTNGGGVMKYDGEYLQQYTIKNGVPGNVIRAIFEDSKGNIWFAGYGSGVSKFDGHQFINYSTSNGLNHDWTFSIVEDKEGAIWVSSQNGVNKIYSEGNKERITSFTVDNGLSSPYILSMEVDFEGNIWFGTYGAGVCKYDGTSFTYLTNEDGLINNIVYSIYEDNSHKIWFGTEGGISKLTGEKLINYTTEEGLPANPTRDITEGKDSSIWIATFGGGLVKLKDYKMTVITENDGLTSNELNVVLPINTETIFVGTNEKGINIIHPNGFYNQIGKNGFPLDDIFPISKDQEENLIFSVEQGEVYRKKGDSLISIPKNRNGNEYSIQAISEDNKGNIWIADYKLGLILIKGDSMRIFTQADGLIHPALSSLFIDAKGIIWMGTYGAGLLSYDGNNFTSYRKNLSYNTATCFTEDDNGNLWIGLYGWGVVKYDRKTFTHYTEKEGFLGYFIWDALKDNQGNMWFSTEMEGVNIYDGEKFKTITTKDGLIDNKVKSLTKGKGNDIWVGTAKGLSLIALDSNNKQVFKSYNNEDGNAMLDFNSQAGVVDKENNYWGVTNGGLIKLNTTNANLLNNPPQLFINEIAINHSFIDFHHLKADEFSDSIFISSFEENQIPFFNYPEKLNLPYKYNSLTFYYSAKDFSAQHKVRYSYKVEGYIEKWSTPSSATEIDLQNIPYGEYTIKIKAKGESSLWSNPIEYKFTIAPPFYHTWWARVIYGVLALFFIWIIIIWRTFKLKERQKQLEEEIDVATHEIKAQKEEVEQQKDIIEEKHKEITDSINYAERIQRSFLATKELLGENLKDYFVFFKPKDVVSGDFYWAGKLKNGNFAVVNADSTGHGVPGAIMSILNISSIEKAIDQGLTEPAAIFNSTRNTIIARLKKDGSLEGGKDGMDASIVCFDFENNKFTYTAANNPVWIIRNNELIEIKPEKMPVGKHDNDSTLFTQGEFELQKGDLVYTLTDGFPDQFGGEKGKKFMSKNLKALLVSIAHLPMQEQEEQLHEIFTNWKGELEQVDDVCLIGVRI